MSDLSPVQLARTALVAKFGSLWEAAYHMRLDMSGGQLLTAMQRTPIDPVIAVLIHTQVGIDLSQKA